MKNKRGFTLIEILIVLVVLVTVTTGATIGIKEIQKKSEQKSLRELYTMVETAADTYLNLNDESRLELLNDEITEKCIRVYILQNAGLVKSDLDNPVTKKRVPGNLCVISYINEEGVIENYFDLDDNLETHKVTLKIVDGKNTSTESKSVYTKAIFNLAVANSKFILNGTCDGGATLKIDGSKVVVYGVKKDQTCTINIKNKENKVTVNVINGKVNPTEQIIQYGKDSNTFTLSGNIGHSFSSLSCKGTDTGKTTGTLSNNNTNLIVKNVTEPVTCTVTYNINTYTLTVSGVNGTIGSPNSVQVSYGTTKEFTLNPSEGYKVEGATTTCKNATIDVNNKKLIFTNVNQSQSCTVTFYPITYKVILNNQSATSSGTTEVYYQYNTTKTINNVKCYYYTDSTLKTCITSGTTITKPTRTGYTFSGYFTAQNAGGIQYVNNNGVFINNIYKTVGNRTLYANWTINQYKVTLTVSGGAGSTSKNINYNSSGTFTGVSPSTGYTATGVTVSCDGGATASISGTTVTVSGVTKAQTCTVKFPVDKYTLKITAKNCTPTSASYEVNNGSDKDIHFTPNANMALKSYSCTNNQTITYKGNNQFTVNKLTANTTCTIEYTAVTKSFAYKSSEQTYTIPYTGYYDITAYGAQGAGSGGKGGKIIGRVKLTKGDVITVITGGNDGTNGGGAGLYKGGGSTIIKKGTTNLIIAAGGGGGAAGTAGGDGNGAGGAAASTGATGTNGGPGTKGTNGGGGGSGYNYTYYVEGNTCISRGDKTCNSWSTSCTSYGNASCGSSRCDDPNTCYNSGTGNKYYCSYCKSTSQTCNSWSQGECLEYNTVEKTKAYKSGNGGKSSVGTGVTAVENTAGGNSDKDGKASLTYYKESL